MKKQITISEAIGRLEQIDARDDDYECDSEFRQCELEDFVKSEEVVLFGKSITFYSDNSCEAHIGFDEYKRFNHWSAAIRQIRRVEPYKRWNQYTKEEYDQAIKEDEMEIKSKIEKMNESTSSNLRNS